MIKVLVNIIFVVVDPLVAGLRFGAYEDNFPLYVQVGIRIYFLNS